MKNRVKSLLKNLGALCIGVFVSLIFVEIILRMYNPFQGRIRGYTINLPKNTSIKYHPENPAFDKEIIHKKNSIGFRGEEPPFQWNSYLKIITVGGSTTECYYLSEGKTWTDILGARLKEKIGSIWINNAGMDGASSFGHYLLMKQYIAQLKPDMVIFLVGLNDLSVGPSNTSRYDQHFNRDLIEQIKTKNYVQLFSRYSEIFPIALNIYRYYNAKKQGLIVDGGKMGHGAVNFSSLSTVKNQVSASMKKEYSEKNKKNAEVYDLKLKKLVEISKENGIEPVFVTQPALYGCYTDPTTKINMSEFPTNLGFDGKVTLNSCVTWEFLEMYNDVTRRIAKENNFLLIDLAKEMPKDTKYYYDYFHYNNEGAKEVGEIIARGLIPYLKKNKKI